MLFLLRADTLAWIGPFIDEVDPGLFSGTTFKVGLIGGCFVLGRTGEFLGYFVSFFLAVSRFFRVSGFF